MKNILFRIFTLSFVCVFIFSFCTVAFANESYVMKIDENTVIKEVDDVMYGINQEWSTTNRDYYLRGNSQDPGKPFVDCYKESIALARMAGTSSDWVKWKSNLGDVNLRTPNRLWGATGIVHYGIVEWLRSIKAADEDAKLTYVVNIISDSYENMADVVEFLSGDGTINYNGGVNWANVRKAYGLEEPANIYVYEIGNETDTTGGGGIDVEEYIRRCKKAISVIRTIDRDAKIAVHNSTVSNLATHDFFDQRVLQEIGDQIDYISTHGYYFPDDYAAEARRAITKYEDRINRMQQNIKNITGSDRIKIYMSEHACWRYSSDTTAGYDFVFPHTMRGTLTTAEWFLRAMWYPSLEASTYHSTHSSSWCIAYLEGKEMKMSAIGNLLQIMKKHGVGEVLKSKLNGFGPLEKTYLSAQAVRCEDGINLIIVNSSEKEKKIEFDFDNEYYIDKISYIQSDDYKADKYVGADGINIVKDKEVKSDTPLKDYTVDRYSITVLNLTKTPDAKAVAK